VEAEKKGYWIIWLARWLAAQGVEAPGRHPAIVGCSVAIGEGYLSSHAGATSSHLQDRAQD
jgi:hypothetical protein